MVVDSSNGDAFKLSFSKEMTKESSNVRVQFCENLSMNITLSEDGKQEFGSKELDILINHQSNEKTYKDVKSFPIIDTIKYREEYNLCKKSYTC